jgi:DNA-binding transcriptional ArsR family regulator
VILLIGVLIDVMIRMMTSLTATVETERAPTTPTASPAQLTARRLAPMLKALADEHRLAILLTLAEGPRSVIELMGELGISQTLVSHHLKALRECRLVSVTPKGRSNVYSMCCGAVAEPVRYLAGIAVAAQAANEQGA